MGLAQTRLGKVACNETPAAVHIPYICHLDPYTVLTENQDLIQVIKLQGISYETVDDDLLNVYHEQRNNLYRNIARGQLALWTTLIRQREIRYPAGDYQGFAAALNRDYRARIAATDLYRNDLYLALVYRDTGALRMITAARKMRQPAPGRLQKHLKALRDLSDEVIKAFSPYEPRRLGTYRHGRMVCSEPLEYLGRLLNGRFEHMPLARADAKALLVQGRLSFGDEYSQEFAPSVEDSPFRLYGDNGTVTIEVRSINFLDADTAVVRLKRSVNRQGERRESDWMITLSFSYLLTPGSESDRFVNPLGFQVTQYRKDPMVLD